MRISAVLFLMVGFLAPFGLQANVEFQPHRAYYTITLAGRPTLHTDITDVRGTMMVEYNKVGGGWTIQQLSEVWRYHDDDSVEHIRWGYVTYEADDGSLFKFNTFHKKNDLLVEDIRGMAKKKGKVTEIVYQKPQEKILSLPEGVLFPLQQIKEILKAAQRKEHMFSGIVFDGSGVEGASEIDTFIGAEKVSPLSSVNEKNQQFAGQPFWSVRFAVYGLGKTDYEPDYVTTQELLPNGIIKQYVIDDGTVKIRGILDRIELLGKEEY